MRFNILSCRIVRFSGASYAKQAVTFLYSNVKQGQKTGQRLDVIMINASRERKRVRCCCCLFRKLKLHKYFKAHGILLAMFPKIVNFAQIHINCFKTVSMIDMLWLVHTPRKRDRDRDREWDWKKWFSIYYAELFILHGTGTWTGTRNRNGKLDNGFYTHFSSVSPGPGPAFPCPGPGSV